QHIHRVRLMHQSSKQLERRCHCAEPSRLPENESLLSHALPVERPPRPTVESALSNDSVIDLSLALARTDGDGNLLREVAGLFIELCPQWMSEIRRAMESCDWTTVKRLAHTLKGSVTNLSADRVADAAHALELQAVDPEHAHISEAWSNLESEITRLMPAVSDIANSATLCAEE